MADTSLIFVLDAQQPFVRQPANPGCLEESWLFDALSFTYLPLLRSCTALETGAIPFKLAISLSPALCEMLADPLLQDRYVDTLDRAIEFGFRELDRVGGDSGTREMVKVHLDQLQLNRRDFVEIYEKNILRKFDYFATHGFIEILATTATACFLPCYADIPEAINAQIETGLMTYRKHFTAIPTGFWLPAMAYSPGLENTLRAYGFQYSFLEAHGLLFSDTAPSTGIFEPAWCENGFAFFARDSLACAELTAPEVGFCHDAAFLDIERDIGFELDEATLAPLFDVKLGRRLTGYRYWSRQKAPGGESLPYQPGKAHSRVCEEATAFLNRRADKLAKAAAAVEGAPVSVMCAFPATLFGLDWYEGIAWLEQAFRAAANRSDVRFALPAACLYQGPFSRPVSPVFSSWTESGYAEEVLNNANDWMYPYIRKATMRMIDLAERFPDDTGLKDRALNMAARELLLGQSMDWLLMMNDSDDTEYARHRFEECVRAFTVVYESLGSNFISTEWLTGMEKKDNLFSQINYRAFSRIK